MTPAQREDLHPRIFVLYYRKMWRARVLTNIYIINYLLYIDAVGVHITLLGLSAVFDNNISHRNY